MPMRHTSKELLTSYCREQLLALDPESIDRQLTTEEFRHIATELGAFWEFDYTELAKIKPGCHARLKSGKHSDGFISFPVLLAHDNILRLLARQMARFTRESGVLKGVTHLAGVPNAATVLANAIACELDLPTLDLRKDEQRHMTLGHQRPTEATVCVIDDVCSSATGFQEAVALITRELPGVQVVPFDVVVVNRGYCSVVATAAGQTQVVSLFDFIMHEWWPDECPLCEDGSIPIKPKETEANWKRLITGQP